MLRTIMPPTSSTRTTNTITDDRPAGNLPVVPHPQDELSTEDLDADLALALRMADEADSITMARFGASDLVVDAKPDLTPVSDADRAVEQMIRDHLSRDRPRDALLGEEFGSTGTLTASVGHRSDRRHQELRPERAGVGDPYRAARWRCAGGRRGVGPGPGPPVVGRARRRGLGHGPRAAGPADPRVAGVRASTMPACRTRPCPAGSIAAWATRSSASPSGSGEPARTATSGRT